MPASPPPATDAPFPPFPPNIIFSEPSPSPVPSSRPSPRRPSPRRRPPPRRPSPKSPPRPSPTLG
jgi:ATP-dependent Lhr-like helicase